MDESRHLMPYKELDALYKNIGNFEADLTRNEAEVLRGALTAIKTVIHMRMQDSIKTK